MKITTGTQLMSLTTGWLLLTSVPVFAQTKAVRIDALVRQYADNKQFNGAVLVAENGRVIFKKGYGLANMEWNIANAPDTNFGSVRLPSSLRPCSSCNWSKKKS